MTSSTLSCGSNGSNGFLVSDTAPFYLVCKVLSCPSSALLDDGTVEGLDCSSLTLGEACVVTCADGYTAAETLRLDVRSRTAELVTGGFMRVGAVRPQHTHASFHSESRLPEHTLRGVLRRQLPVRQGSDFRDRVFHRIDLRF